MLPGFGAGASISYSTYHQLEPTSKCTSGCLLCGYEGQSTQPPREGSEIRILQSSRTPYGLLSTYLHAPAELRAAGFTVLMLPSASLLIGSFPTNSLISRHENFGGSCVSFLEALRIRRHVLRNSSFATAAQYPRRCIIIPSKPL